MSYWKVENIIEVDDDYGVTQQDLIDAMWFANLPEGAVLDQNVVYRLEG